MEKTATHYLFDALFVVKENISYVFIPVILTSGFYLSQFVSEDFKLLFYFTIGITLFIITPLLYGQFIEIINADQKDTWLNIFNNYWLKVFWVSLILKTPEILFDLFGSEISTVKELLTLTIEVISIYILPLVLLKKEIISSLKLGIKCLLGNLKFSYPIVLVLIFSYIFPILLTTVVKSVNIQFLAYTFSVILIFLSTLIEFAVFVAASLILKEKLLTTFHEVI
ncbi:MAG: hypothetical protein C0403_17665 [Desulfobacterium sp.]|nr:hypothetical protein [Desulfobacterium sp.]